LYLDKVEAEILSLGQSFPCIENTQLVATNFGASTEALCMTGEGQ
jgi:hypothetical protein